jgi:hypothetical protein
METKSYTGYSKTKRYRVIIKQIEVDENTAFTYYTSRKDLRKVIDNHIRDFNIEQDYQLFIKLDEMTKDGTSNVDLKVTVNFEETRNLFYVPKPVNIFTEKGMHTIECAEEYEITIPYAAVINYEDYPTKILEVMNGLIDKKGVSSTKMPIFLLLICYDSELDMYEAFPVSVTVNFYPTEELSSSEKGQRARVLQFRDFVDDLGAKDSIIKKIWNEL